MLMYMWEDLTWNYHVGLFDSVPFQVTRLLTDFIPPALRKGEEGTPFVNVQIIKFNINNPISNLTKSWSPSFSTAASQWFVWDGACWRNGVQRSGWMARWMRRNQKQLIRWTRDLIVLDRICEQAFFLHVNKYKYDACSFLTCAGCCWMVLVACPAKCASEARLPSSIHPSVVVVRPCTRKYTS